MVQPGEELSAGLAIEQSRNREAVSGLVGANRCLCLGRKDAVDRAWIKPEVLQVPFCDLDLALGQEAVQGGASRFLRRRRRRRAGATGRGAG